MESPNNQAIYSQNDRNSVRVDHNCVLLAFFVGLRVLISFRPCQLKVHFRMDWVFALPFFVPSRMRSALTRLEIMHVFKQKAPEL